MYTDKMSERVDGISSVNNAGTNDENKSKARQITFVYVFCFMLFLYVFVRDAKNHHFCFSV